MDTAKQLSALVAGFASRPSIVGRLIRGLAEADPAGFQVAAQRLLAEFEETPGFQYLLTLLLSHNLLIPGLMQLAAQDRPRAYAAVRMALRLDPQFDVQLMNLAAARRQSVQSGSGERALLSLDLLENCEPRPKLVPQLARILRGGDSRLASKAALLIGRIMRSPRWLAERLLEPDARIRANAVESLWGAEIDDPESLFRTAAEDPHARVVANAIVGLYLAGSVTALPRLGAMLAAPDEAFRKSGAWAAGHIADPRFAPLLGPLAQTAGEGVRRNAAHALRRIETAEAAARRRPPATLAVLSTARRAEDAAIEFTAYGDAGAPLAPPRPVDVLVTAGGVPVLDYRVRLQQGQAQLNPARMILVLPPPACDGGLGAALEQTAAPAGPNLEWAVVYHGAGRGSAAPQYTELPLLLFRHSLLEAVAAARRGLRGEPALSLREAVLYVLPFLAARARGHVVVLSGGDPVLLGELARQADRLRPPGACVHALALGEPAAENAPNLRCARDAAEFAGLLRAVYASVDWRASVEFHAAAGGEIRLAARFRSHWAPEVTLPAAQATVLEPVLLGC